MFRVSAINPGAGRYSSRALRTCGARISARGPAELYREGHARPQRIGQASVVRRPGTSLVEPTAAARASTAAVTDDHDGPAGGFVIGKANGPASANVATPRTAVSATTSSRIADALCGGVAATKGGNRRGGVDDAATNAAAVACTGSAEVGRVIGVSEAAAVGGSDGWSNQRYWALDGAEEGRRRGFVAQTVPSRSIEKTKGFQRAEAMLALVLPSGFPDSVRNPYSSYAGWQFAGMAASAAAGVMSTQALLYAMGLGAGAIPLAATLNWVIKDGLGQLGGVAFTSLVNTRFDANPKLWRVVAAVSLDASMVLELLSPLAPAYFLPIASVANIGKNISFLAASASRAAIHNVLSAKGNLADVTAKSGAQTILACMVGTGAGVTLSAVLGSEFQAIVPACLCLSAVHLAANFMSMQRLGIPTFDSQRLELVTDALVRCGGSQDLITPQDAAVQEKIVLYAAREKLGLDLSPKVSVGSGLEEAVKDWEELENLCRACRGLPFLLAVRGDRLRGTGEVHVLLLEGCGARDVLAGSYVAMLAKRLLLERGLVHRPSGRRRRRWRERLSLQPFRESAGSEPEGDLLPEVIAEALRQGAALLASPRSSSSSPSSSPSSLSKTEAFTLQGDGRDQGEKLPSSPPPSPLQSTGSGDDDAGKLGSVIVAELSARAERSGWNTSVLFLEKAGAVRLRLVRQLEEGGKARGDSERGGGGFEAKASSTRV